MKIYYVCILAVLPLLCHSYPAEEAEKAIVVEDSDHAESESSQISKRSGGSFDIVQHLKSGLLSGVGRASASFASSSSGGSGGGYKGGEHSNSVDFDPWTLKKSVLNTIFQAVKAITGGVTAIKGQLIKGSGYALSASGKLVAASGDKVTNVGKAIVNSAQLVPAGGHGGSGGGGSHPLIGKLSGLSGASSSSSSGHGHSGPVGHSETITTYEIPSGHGSYGPPSKAPSYPTATHQYLPPGAFSGGAPFTGHAAFEGSPSLSYQPSKYGISVEGQSSGHYGPLSQREAQSASKALKEIIHLLPFTKPKATTEAPSHTYKVVEQYSIPSDPIPDYKPVIETITHSQSLTTAYDGSFPSSPSASEDNFISNEQYPPNSNYDSPQAYDVYRAMAKKYKNSDPSPSYTSSNKQPVTSTIVITSGSKGSNGYSYNQGSQLGPIYASASQKHTFYVPPPRNTHRFQSKQDFRYRPRRPQAPPSRRKNFEIYKSKGYQIRDPAQFNRQLLY